MLIDGRRLVERATRWLVRANPRAINIEITIRYFQPGAKMLARDLPDVLDGADREAFAARRDELRRAGVPDGLAERVAGMPSMVSLFDIVEVARATKRSEEAVMRIYFRLGSRLELNWLRDRIIELPRTNRWQELARAALRDDLYNLYRELTQNVLGGGGSDSDSEAAIDAWSRRNADAVGRALGMLADIKASGTYDTTTLPVALREVRNLIRGGATGDGVTGAEPVTRAG
jgi:glutamate dehydrogenase